MKIKIIGPMIVTLTILFILLIVMILTNEMNWNAADFIIMGILLFGTGILVKLANQKIKNKNHRIMTIAVIILLFLWIWIELAVGLLTNWGN